MDAYPDDYVNHNLPLVLLSGLEAGPEDNNETLPKYPLLAERGHHIFSDFPPLSGAVAEELRQVLLAEDGSQMPWKAGHNPNGNQSGSRIGYRIKSTGRVSLSRIFDSFPMRTANLLSSLINFPHAKPTRLKVPTLQARRQTRRAMSLDQEHIMLFTRQSHHYHPDLLRSPMDCSRRCG